MGEDLIVTSLIPFGWEQKAFPGEDLVPRIIWKKYILGMKISSGGNAWLRWAKNLATLLGV